MHFLLLPLHFSSLPSLLRSQSSSARIELSVYGNPTMTEMTHSFIVIETSFIVFSILLHLIGYYWPIHFIVWYWNDKVMAWLDLKQLENILLNRNNQSLLTSAASHAAFTSGWVIFHCSSTRAASSSPCRDMIIYRTYFPLRSKPSFLVLHQYTTLHWHLYSSIFLCHLPQTYLILSLNSSPLYIFCFNFNFILTLLHAAVLNPSTFSDSDCVPWMICWCTNFSDVTVVLQSIHIPLLPYPEDYSTPSVLNRYLP